MKILEILKFLNETTEKERLIKNVNNLDKAFPKNEEINKERFFRRIANVIEDKLDSIDIEKESQSARNQIFNSETMKSFALKPNDIEGLRTLLGEIEYESYAPLLSKSSPALSDGWLKGIYQGIANYVSPELKRGRKVKTTVTKERQLSLDISSLFQALYSVKPGSAGPGELLLSLIFGGTKAPNKSSVKGDIIIGNTFYEVKADGTGALDAGYREIEEEMRNVQGEELTELRSKFEQEKKRYEMEISKCTKLAQKFAKVLAREYNLNAKDVKDYFAILTEEDKKRAILYGFYECGYQNFIICSPKKSKTDFDVYVKVVTKEMLKSVIDNKGVSLKSIGIDIIDASGNYTNTCKFGDYLIKMI